MHKRSLLRDRHPTSPLPHAQRARQGQRTHDQAILVYPVIYSKMWELAEALLCVALLQEVAVNKWRRNKPVFSFRMRRAKLWNEPCFLRTRPSGAPRLLVRLQDQTLCDCFQRRTPAQTARR